METPATILHADLDAFYASVEQLLDPALRGKPIAVGGGVVLAASYEAKAFGIRSGMPGRRARELCPQLIFVGGHFGDYQRLGDAAIKVLNDFTPLVERISIDEAFADVAGCTRLFGPPAEIASAIRRRLNFVRMVCQIQIRTLEAEVVRHRGRGTHFLLLSGFAALIWINAGQGRAPRLETRLAVDEAATAASAGIGTRREKGEASFG